MSPWVRVSTKFSTVMFSICFRTGEIEFGVMALTKAGPVVRVTDWEVSDTPFTVTLSVAVVIPVVN